MRDVGRIVIYLGAGACGLTVLLLMAYLGIAYFPPLSALLERETAAEFAFYSALGGVFYLIVGGLGYLSSKLLLRRSELATE
jgi:hypothetical protein